MPTSRRPRDLVTMRFTKSETGRAAQVAPVTSRRKVMVSPAFMLDFVRLMWSKASPSGAQDDSVYTKDKAGGQGTACRPKECGTDASLNVPNAQTTCCASAYDMEEALSSHAIDQVASQVRTFRESPVGLVVRSTLVVNTGANIV